MQLDYGAILRQGQNLVPNLRDQLVQDALLKMEQQQFNAAQQQQAAQQQAAQQQSEQEAAFQADLEDAMLTGDPRKILALRMRYPEMAKGMKEAFDSLDEGERRRNLTQVGSIYANLNAGNLDRATQLLRQRIEADRATGQADPQDEAILAELESGDPMRVNAAKATVGIMLAAIEPDKFGENYARLNPAEAKTADERQYEFDLRTYGKAYADQAKLTRDSKTIGLAPGGRLDVLGPDPSLMGGGVQSQGGMPATQGGGDPSGSGAGLSVDQFRANASVLGPERAAAMTARNGIPVRVRSVQEANSLPPGTLYETPTGERYTR
jgi:hypothetical protein